MKKNAKFIVLPDQRRSPGHSKLHPYYDFICESLEEGKTYKEIVTHLPISSTGTLSSYIKRYSKNGVPKLPRLPRRAKVFEPVRPALVSPPPPQVSQRPLVPESKAEKKFDYRPGAKLTLKRKNQTERNLSE